MNKLIGLLIVVFVCSASGWRIFRRGRERHGNLGEPATPHKDEPAELWFEQKLDHFDHSNIKTWKQVNNFSFIKRKRKKKKNKHLFVRLVCLSS